MSFSQEEKRLNKLHEYKILDTESEAIFDELAQLSADFCDAPMAAISLVDSNREWFKSKIGFTASEIPRNSAFGNYTILQDSILIVSDTLEDEKFVNNYFVKLDPCIRFYAGITLIDAHEFALGCLCVMDVVPRSLSIKEQKALRNLGKQVTRILDLRQQKIIDCNYINLGMLFTHNSNPMWIYDCETLEFLDVNEAAITQYGYSRTEFLQMQITDIRPSTDIPVLMEKLATKKLGLNFVGQWQHLHKNGHLIDVEITTHSINYYGHKAEIVTIQNITQYKHIERKFHESEERFRLITEAIPMPLMILRIVDGIILYANHEFMQTFGFASTDLLNRPISDLYAETIEFKIEFKLLLEKLSQRGYIHNYELRFKRKNGDYLWTIASLQYLNFNNELVILAVFYDITERKSSESLLQEQKDFLQSIFENIPLMIAINDDQGRVQWVNNKLEQTLGWTLNDFKTRDLFLEIYPDPEYRQYVINCMQFAQGTWHDFKTTMQNGNMLDTTWTNVKLNNGRTIGIGKDITARKQAERMLKNQINREQLMHFVAQRIRQSLDIDDILNATVKEMRDLLQVNRVVVYQFAPDMSGKIVAESVESGWTVTLGLEIIDTCFQSNGAGKYYYGHKVAIANIYEAGLTDCHIKLLTQFEVKANLVVPILLEVNEEVTIWGLLIAHQCSNFRTWEDHQLELLDQVTVQMAIAIQQANIFQQAQNELIQRQQAEIKLRSALAEKEVLLKEVHHRVKNNLQIVSGLLQLQSQTLKNPEVTRAIKESQNRIESISLIHKNLYTTPNIGQIDVREYINNLATGLLISYQIIPGKITLKTNIAAVRLDVDQAIPCGLIINELISNAIKHAFPNHQPGKLSINLHTNDNNIIEIEIRDNGIGLINNLDWRNTNSLGLSLVYDLVIEQLEGTISIEYDQGTVFKIQFPSNIA